MQLKWTSMYALVAMLSVPILASGCQQAAAEVDPASAGLASKSNVNGAGGQQPTFYDGKLFTVNMMELADDASDALIGHSGAINHIYATNDLDDDQDFFPVIDAIQGDGFNPLWQQFLIVYNDGVTPFQLKSDEEVDDAEAAGKITLIETDEMYRCSVVGQK